MRHSIQLGIVALSFNVADLFATGPIDHIRFMALCRGKRRLSTLRAAGRRVQRAIDTVGLAVWTVFAAIRGGLRAGCGYVSLAARTVHGALSMRISRAWARVVQVGRVCKMFFALYGVLIVSRKVKGVRVGCNSVPAEPVAVVVQAVGDAYAMPAAARITKADDADDKATVIKRAKRMVAKGMSKRATAKELGVAESTLRGWMKGE